MTLRKASLLVAAFAFSSLVVAQRCSKLSARNTLVKALKCMGQQEAHFDAIEAESDADVMRKLNRCFVREGRSQCGSVRQILGRDVFGGTSDVNSDCPVCGGIIESTTKDYLSHPKRECISQAFLDEVSVRLQRCTGGAITQMADPDAAATRHYPALKKSITVGVSWRHQLDECRLSGKTRWAARVDKCMARRRPLCTYCKHVSGSCFNSKGGQCKKYAQRQAGQLCRCFFDNRPSLMEALKRVVAIVAKRQKDKGVKGWDVKEDCENVLRSEFEGMKAYGAGKLEINWLAIYEAAVDKCVDKKIDAVNANINFGCVLTQVEFQPKEPGKKSIGGARQLRKAFGFISNFANAIMERISRFCHCSPGAVRRLCNAPNHS